MQELRWWYRILHAGELIHTHTQSIDLGRPEWGEPACSTCQVLQFLQIRQLSVCGSSISGGVCRVVGIINGDHKAGFYY